MKDINFMKCNDDHLLIRTWNDWKEMLLLEFKKGYFFSFHVIFLWRKWSYLFFYLMFHFVLISQIHFCFVMVLFCFVIANFLLITNSSFGEGDTPLNVGQIYRDLAQVCQEL